MDVPYAAVDEGESRDFHVHDCHVVLACPARGPSADYVVPVDRGAWIQGGTAGDGIYPRDDNRVGMEGGPAVEKMMSVNGSAHPSQRCEEGGADSGPESVLGGVGVRDEE